MVCSKAALWSPRKDKKNLTKKIFHEFSEFKDFGNIKRIKQFPADNNIIMYRENISSDVVQVFWNRESNEIIKFLGNNVYAHFDSESECPIRDGIRTIPESAGGISCSQRSKFFFSLSLYKILQWSACFLLPFFFPSWTSSWTYKPASRYIHVLYYLYYKNRAYLIVISSWDTSHISFFLF